MDRKTAETLMQGAVRATLLAHLDEAYALGKKAAKDRLTGQESLFGDEEENDHEERSLKLDAEVIRDFEGRFKTLDTTGKWSVSRELKPDEWYRWMLKQV